MLMFVATASEAINGDGLRIVAISLVLGDERAGALGDPLIGRV